MKKRRSRLCSALAVLAWSFAACHSLDVEQHVYDAVQEQRAELEARTRLLPARTAPRDDRDRSTTVPHVFAIYDREHLLINEPLAELQELARNRKQPFTDVYVVCHGWNFTTASGIEQYRYWLRNFAEKHDLFQLAMNKEFRPLVVAVSWVSVSQPISEIGASLLPESSYPNLKGVFEAADVAFHIPSAWNESYSAVQNALGKSNYRDRKWQDGNYRVGALVARLCEEDSVARVHMVGHSYGAKLMALAAIKARQSRQAAAKIESLVLFNPAFHPSELVIESGSAAARAQSEQRVRDTLRGIRTKAIVYSAWDNATGLVFGWSQMLSNARLTLGINDGVDDADSNATGFVVGAIGTVAKFPLSVLDWAAQALYLLPFDFAHHVAENDTVGTGLLPGVFNAFHYFLPLEAIWMPVDADKLGLWRPVYHGLGRSGLAHHSRGRPITHPLTPFTTEHTGRSSAEFIKMAAHVHLKWPDGLPPFDDAECCYSFDASDVFDTGLPWSHGDLRKADVVADLTGRDVPYVLRMIDCSTNFVFNLTTAKRCNRPRVTAR